MMQFYKKRDFGTLITDTFNFFKFYGKNYFKNYILLNGLLLIAIVVVFIFGYRELFMQLMGSNLGGESYFMDAYFQENSTMLILVLGVVFLLFMVLMILIYLYPVFYMKRIASGQASVTNDEILSDFKKNINKILIFSVCTLFIIYPIGIILFGITYLLMIIIIGFFLMLLIMPTFINAFMFLVFDYFNTNKGFFESLSYGIRSQFSYAQGKSQSPFWKYWGSIVVTYFMTSIVTGIFTMIPMVIYFIIIFAFPQDGNFEQNPMKSGFGIGFFVIYGVSLLVSFILNNFVFVNSGLMYYDSRTDLHQQEKLSEIDRIGLNEE